MKGVGNISGAFGANFLTPVRKTTDLYCLTDIFNNAPITIFTANDQSKESVKTEGKTTHVLEISTEQGNKTFYFEKTKPFKTESGSGVVALGPAHHKSAGTTFLGEGGYGFVRKVTQGGEEFALKTVEDTSEKSNIQDEIQAAELMKQKDFGNDVVKRCLITVRGKLHHNAPARYQKKEIQGQVSYLQTKTSTEEPKLLIFLCHILTIH